MITIKDVEHVAKLARLQLTEEEKEKFTKQLGDVLKHVDAMNEVDTSDVEPMAHAIDFVNVMREDKVYYEQTKEELMKNAPDEENGFFRVPKINQLHKRGVTAPLFYIYYQRVDTSPQHSLQGEGVKILRSFQL